MTYKLKGKNKLHLNNVTVQQIIQEWLDSSTQLEGRVVNVTYLMADHCFEITVMEAEQNEE